MAYVELPEDRVAFVEAPEADWARGIVASNVLICGVLILRLDRGYAAVHHTPAPGSKLEDLQRLASEIALGARCIKEEVLTPADGGHNHAHHAVLYTGENWHPFLNSDEGRRTMHDLRVTLDLPEDVLHIVKPNNGGKETSWDVRIQTAVADGQGWVAQRDAAKHGRIPDSLMTTDDGRKKIYKLQYGTKNWRVDGYPLKVTHADATNDQWTHVQLPWH